MNNEIKKAVSVSEMAKMVGLSRQRFYQLMGTAFPRPLYHEITNRPYYSEDLQQVCLEVRKRNCGINGKPILFYSTGYRQKDQRPRDKPRRTQSNTSTRHVGLINGLAALGLSVKADQIDSAIKHLFPNGTDKIDEAEVLREVFLFLKRQDSGDNVR